MGVYTIQNVCHIRSLNFSSCKRCLSCVNFPHKFRTQSSSPLTSFTQNRLSPYTFGYSQKLNNMLYSSGFRLTLRTSYHSWFRDVNLVASGLSAEFRRSCRCSPTHLSQSHPQTCRQPQAHLSTHSARRHKEVSDREWIQPEGFDTGINVYNSLTRKKQPLILPNGRIATWYSCGPTVYDQAHIGHASAYVRTDIIRRVLMNLYNIDVVYVMGITDIDDKIIKRAKELRMDFKKMAHRYEKEFFRDMESLKVLPPTVRTRVTDHMPHIIDFIQRIIDNGFAYITSNGVYFDVKSYGRYGRLWTHSMDTEIRDAVDQDKRSPRDFALWKSAKPGEPIWESPFGPGRPGWHIECSTMASAVFGEKLDIHSGGDDLRFPHHENEMAQSEACFGCNQWTNYWLHTGYLHQPMEKAKMSKSLKNTITVSDLLQKYTPNQYRLFCMLRPYRQLVEYSEESMLKAVRIHTSWAAFLNTAETYISGQLQCQPINEGLLNESLEETKQKISLALADDFDTNRAIGAMEELVHRANIELGRKVVNQSGPVVRSPGVIAGVVAYVDRIMELFGIQVSKKKKISASDVEHKFSHVMDSMVKFRGKVRTYALKPKEKELSDSSSDDSDGESNPLEEKVLKRLDLEKNKPLLEACDTLRDEVKMYGLQIADHGTESSWDILEQPNLPTAASGSPKTPKK